MTPDELEQLAEQERAAQEKFSQGVSVCVSAACLSCQSEAVKEALRHESASLGVTDYCHVKGVGCMGLCSEGPLVSTSSGCLYKRVTPSDAADIIESLDGAPVSRLICRTDIPFFQRQKKIVLEKCGIIDPDRI